MSDQSMKITAVTPEQASKILSAAYKRRITDEQVRQVAEEAAILRADDTFSLFDYVAFLAQEVTRGSTD